MEFIIAKCAGFCEGVERAYKIALKQTKQGQPAFMLGNLVHNAQVVDKLKAQGLTIVKDLSEVPKGKAGTLLISAHGVAPRIYEEARSRGLQVVDTTCSWVKRAQKLARDLAEKNDKVVIVGDQGHPEVVGLLGWAGGKGLVVQGVKEVEGLPQDIKVGAIAQTTQLEERFDEVIKALKKKFKKVEVHNTICGATSKRQNAALEVAKKVELMLVIGDKLSANTKRLTELCKQSRAETHQIQTASELDPEWLKGKNKIGITAGASTPDWVIEEVINAIREGAR